MGKGLLDLIVDSILDDAWVGKRGEKLTEKELKRVFRRGLEGKILRNIYLPKENGETSEVDVVYITQKGVFIIESKNYSGWIFGDEKGRSWTVSLPNGQKNSFYNPIVQNKTHLKWMRQFVGDDVPLFSIIAFSERCELKKVTVYSEDVKVIKRDKLNTVIGDIWDRSPDALSEDRVEKIFEDLSALTDVDKSVKTAHIENIEKKLENVCPRCGSELVLRTAKKGANAGNQFLGCSAFPKCRFTKQVGE